MHALRGRLCRKHRTEPVPAEPHGFVADIDAAFGQ
jgi:hypothetical protein